MLMNGINELITIAKYWKEWSDPRLIVMVLANRDLNQVTWEQRIMSGDPKFKPSQDVPRFQVRPLRGPAGIERHCGGEARADRTRLGGCPRREPTPW